MGILSKLKKALELEPRRRRDHKAKRKIRRNKNGRFKKG